MDARVRDWSDRALAWVAIKSHSPLTWSPSARLLVVVGSFAVGAAIAAIDLMLPFEMVLAFVYLLPITAIAWYAGRWWGLALSFAAAIAWFLDDLATHGVPYPAGWEWVAYWNAAAYFVVFGAMTVLLSSLKLSLSRERKLARTDKVTETANRLYFMEILEQEIERSRVFGYPLTVGYLDLDNFKKVNDEHGHLMGDVLLKLTAQVMRRQVRSTDTVARIGGDEFAVLLAGADAKQARKIMHALHEALMRTAMELPDVPSDFGYSLGVVTFNDAPDVDAVLACSDRLMYAAKQAGKGCVVFEPRLTLCPPIAAH